jgi:hypothetical protein
MKKLITLLLVALIGLTACNPVKTKLQPTDKECVTDSCVEGISDE